MRFTAFQHQVAAAVAFHHSFQRIQKQPDDRPPHLGSKCLEVAFKQTTMCVYGCLQSFCWLAQLNRCIDEYGYALKAMAAAVVHRAATFSARQNELYVYL